MINTSSSLSDSTMQVDNDKRKMPTSIEIVDVPPLASSSTSNEISFKPEDDDTVSAGTTKLSKEQIQLLFQGRNLAFLATLSKDGSPHVTPVWAEMVKEGQDDLILINTFETSAKNKHVTDDNRIALSIVDQNNPFNMASIKGKVIEQTTEGADEHLKTLAKKYLGIGKYYYRKPNHKRVIIKIKPQKIMGISIHPAFYFLAYSPWNR
jgi:PPOX class probable F420-dependent enzyme